MKLITALKKHAQYLFISVIVVMAAQCTFAQVQQKDVVAAPAGAAMTYQGRLVISGTPANGNYDFQFNFLDVNGTLIQTIEALGVPVANGIFTAQINVNAGTFSTGAASSMAIAVRSLPTEAYTPISPAQPITFTPYAFRAQTADQARLATNSTQLGGLPPDQYITVTDSRLTDARDPLPGSGNYIQNSTDQQAASFNINGTGTAAILNAFNVNSLFQYSLNGAKFITAPGTANTILGLGSGASVTTGIGNSFFGKDGGKNSTDGSNNSFFGFEAGKTNISGNQNSYFGAGAGRASSLNANNSFFGYGAGRETVNSENSFFGSEAGLLNTTGYQNAFFGAGSGYSNTQGSQNSFFGIGAGHLATASYNSVFGSFAGYLTTTGTANAFFGMHTGYNTTTGSNNTFIGAEAGVSNGLGSNLTLVGANTNVPVEGTLQFATAIGAGSTVSSNNTITLGRNNGADKVVITGEAEIGSIKLTNTPIDGFRQMCISSASRISVCPVNMATLVDTVKAQKEQILKLQTSVAGLQPTVNSAKEQQVQIDQQKEQIKAQQAQIDQLKKMICSVKPSKEVCEQ